MIKRTTIFAVIMVFLSIGPAAAQENDDQILVAAYEYYVDGVNTAIQGLKRCLPTFGSSWTGGETAKILNGLESIGEGTDKLVCELRYNSRMIQLQIEVQLILAGINSSRLRYINRP